jgi:hypothetical protein
VKKRIEKSVGEKFPELYKLSKEKKFVLSRNKFFPTSLMKMILSSLNLVRKIGVCITSEENGESKLTSEESLFNNLLPTY